MKAAIYIRVSTTQQVDRESLSTQEERLKQFCNIKGYKIYKVYREEGVSGKNLERPAFEALMRDIEKKRVQAIFITRLDRISRSLKDVINLMEFLDSNSVKLISLSESIDTSGSTGRFMLNMLASIAQLERENGSERVSADMHHRALNGKWNGGVVPYGYITQSRYAKELVLEGMDIDSAAAKASKKYPDKSMLYIDKEEAEIVNRMFKQYLEVKSLRKLTHELNRTGFKTRKNDYWGTTSVRRILSNKTYMGKICYGKRKTDLLSGEIKKAPPDQWKESNGNHKAIIDKELYDRVQNLLVQRTMKPSKARDIYLLTGLLKCSKCNGGMYGYIMNKKKDNKTYNYYRCRNTLAKGKSVCVGTVVPMNIVEQSVIDTILNLSKNEKFLNDKELLLKSLRKEAQPRKPSIEKEKNRLLKEEKSLLRKRNLLLEKLENGVVDDQTFIERTDMIKAELENIRDKIAVLSTKAEDIDLQEIALKTSFDELNNLENMWKHITDEEKRDKLRTIINQIVVDYDRHNHKLNLKMQLFLDFADNSRKPSKYHKLSFCTAGSGIEGSHQHD